MDCKTARTLFPFDRSLGAELDADEAEALANHLTECAECRQLRQGEQAIDAHMGQAMRDVPVPAGLRDRLLNRLAEDRRAMYRRQLIRGACALAAAFLIAALGWFFWPRPLAQVDLASWSQQANFPPQTPEQVEDAFRQRGIVVRVPTEFNYGLLTHYGQSELQGRLVPYLEFRAGGHFLRVYILDRERFDLGFLEQNPEGLSGRVTVKWWGKSADGRCGFVIEHTGQSLEPFKTRDLLPAT
jgi:hypothetical protein